MKKNMISRILMIFMIMYIVFSAFSSTNAATLSEMWQKTHKFLETGKSSTPDIAEPTEEIFSIGSILTSIGVAVMLGATAYMGIKYLTSGPEARAKLKVQLIGLVVSGVVIFGAYYIWKMVIGIASEL